MCRSPLCDFVTLPAAFVNLLAVTSLYVLVFRPVVEVVVCITLLRQKELLKCCA
jgi:uncharacterized membrane protein